MSSVLTVKVLSVGAVLLFLTGCAQQRNSSSPRTTTIPLSSPAKVSEPEAVQPEIQSQEPIDPARVAMVPVLPPPPAPAPTKVASRSQISEAPPPPQVEIVGAPPGSNCVWIPGRWEWHGSWTWVGGKWTTTSRPQAAWIPGRWVHRGTSWTWIDGYWR